ASRKGQQVAGQIGAALRGAADHLDELVELRARAELLHQQLAVTQDYREQVVEVVRHAASELAKRTQALRLPQLLLEFLALTHVVHAADQAQRLPLAIADDEATILDMGVAAVTAA